MKKNTEKGKGRKKLTLRERKVQTIGLEKYREKETSRKRQKTNDRKIYYYYIGIVRYLL